MFRGCELLLRQGGASRRGLERGRLTMEGTQGSAAHIALRGAAREQRLLASLFRPGRPARQPPKAVGQLAGTSNR